MTATQKFRWTVKFSLARCSSGRAGLARQEARRFQCRSRMHASSPQYNVTSAGGVVVAVSLRNQLSPHFLNFLR